MKTVEEILENERKTRLKLNALCIPYTGQNNYSVGLLRLIIGDNSDEITDKLKNSDCRIEYDSELMTEDDTIYLVLSAELGINIGSSKELKNSVETLLNNAKEIDSKDGVRVVKKNNLEWHGQHADIIRNEISVELKDDLIDAIEHCEHPAIRADVVLFTVHDKNEQYEDMCLLVLGFEILVDRGTRVEKIRCQRMVIGNDMVDLVLSKGNEEFRQLVRETSEESTFNRRVQLSEDGKTLKRTRRTVHEIKHGWE